jgi:hypothetical protein
MDCANVAVSLDVGAILRDITGFSEIHDATLSYPEHVCASVSIQQNQSCGLCVPCRVDSDCQPIPVDQIAGQAFGPLGKIATDFLLDQIFGPNSHEIQMYCQTVADGYGVCAPCPGIVNACGVGQPPATNGNSCHPECTAGDPLGAQCGTCATAVCTVDPYCCTTEWDQTCVSEVPDRCAKVCETCAHDKCAAGNALDPACSACVDSICMAIPSCCDSSAGMWTAQCVMAIPQYCEKVYWCTNQCQSGLDCPAGKGCPVQTFMCGPCMVGYDCASGMCDTTTGMCQ